MEQTRVLIVDDEPAIRGLLKSAIAVPHFGFWEAESGEAALECAREGPPFDLVITDVFMNGINGIEMARRLRDAGRARAFLFLSACCDPELLQQAAAEFQARFVMKPFAITELLVAVRVLIEASKWRAMPAAADATWRRQG